MKFYNVNTPPTNSSPDGTYYVKQTDNQDLIDTYIVSKGVVKMQNISEDRIEAVSTDVETARKAITTGIIPAGFENPVTDNVKNTGNWITGQVLMYNGTVTAYASGAYMKIDPSTLCLLNGGAVYECNIQFVTNSISCWLLDVDLKRIASYSVGNGNAENQDGKLVFDIDLSHESHESGIYYLAISTHYSQLTGIINLNFRITNKYSYKKNDLEHEVTRVSSGLDIILDIEGIIPARVENPVTENVKNPGNWITGQVYLFYGTGTTAYATGACMKIDPSTLCLLNGGAIYECSIPFVTANTACWMLDSNLTRIATYSVGGGNGANLDGKLVFDIDLSHVSGIFYLALSTKYNDTTGVINTDIHITNKYSYKKNDASSGAISAGVIENDLKRQGNSFGKIGNAVNYGAADAVYTIPIFGKRISVKFKKQKDINKGTDKNAFVNIISNGVADSAGIQHAPCALEKTVKFPGQNASHMPNPITKSAWYTGGTNTLIEHFHSIGDKLFMLWLKGAKQLTYPEKMDLISRSVYIQNLQDIYILIENNTFTIGRDGVGCDDNTFNGGSTSILFSTPLQISGAWKSVQSLYEELRTHPALSDFYFDFFNLSARTTCESLMQFGKIRLVGYYSQQVQQGTLSTDESYGMYYDSFPCYIFDKVNTDINYLDIIVSGGNHVFFINGERTGTLPVGNEIQLLNGEVFFEDLKIFFDDYGDAELHENILMSDRTPYVLGLMGHVFIDDFETVHTGTSQTATRVSDVCKLLRDKGYIVYTLNDIADYFTGQTKINKRSAFILFDDTQVAGGYLNNIRMRYFYSQFGMPINFALNMDSYFSNDAIINSFISMRLNGFDFCSHSKFHDVPMADKNSLVLYRELDEMQSWCDTMHVNTKAFTYNWSGNWIPVMHMLNIKSYVIAINSSGNYSNLSKSRYRLGRINLTSDFSEIIDNCL